MRRVIVILISILAGVLSQSKIIAVQPVDKPVPLQVRAENGQIRLSAKLSDRYWADVTGTATAQIEETIQDGLLRSNQQVQYQIKELTLSASLPYHPGRKSGSMSVRLTGVSDKKGGTNAVFEGRYVFSEAAKNRESSPGAGEQGKRSGNPNPDQKNEAEAGPNDAGDESAPGGINNPAATESVNHGSIDHHNGQASPDNSRLKTGNSSATTFFVWRDWGLLLSFINTALLVLIAIFAWRKQSKLSIAWRNLDSVVQMKDSVDRLDGSVKTLEQQLEQLQAKPQGGNNSTIDPAALPAASPQVELLGTIDDLRRLIQTAQANATESIGSTPPVAAAAEEPVDARDDEPAGVVNQWLADGARDRRELIQRAQAVGLNSQLVSLKEPAAGWNPASFQYLFEINPSGAWLWTPIAGTGEAWVVPAEAAMLGMGSAPSILRCLFEGMENAKQNFRFKAIYRACRLRRVGGRSDTYELAVKGRLQLAGEPPPASASRPPLLLAAGFRPTSPQTAAESKAKHQTEQQSTLSQALADWIITWSHEVKAQSNVVRELQQRQQQAQTGLPKQREDGGEAARLREELRSLQYSLNRVNEDSASRFRQVHHEITQLNLKLEQLREETRFPADAVPEPATIDNLPAAEPELPVALSLTAVEARKQRQTAIAREDGNQLSGWKQAWLAAAAEPGGEIDLADIPSPAVYAIRILNLQKSMNAHLTSGNASIVHLKIVRFENENTGDAFEIHETRLGDGDPKALYCTKCNHPPAQWQLAVCVEEPGSDQVSIFYPMGYYGQSNFPAGYTALIENPPMCFQLGEPDFAELCIKDRKRQIYAVKRRMACTRPAALAEGRS